MCVWESVSLKQPMISIVFWIWMFNFQIKASLCLELVKQIIQLSQAVKKLFYASRNAYSDTPVNGATEKWGGNRNTVLLRNDRWIMIMSINNVTLLHEDLSCDIYRMPRHWNLWAFSYPILLWFSKHILLDCSSLCSQDMKKGILYVNY